MTFSGRMGYLARLFSKTLEQMLEAELTAQPGYERYEAKVRNSGISRNRRYKRKVKTSQGEATIGRPHDLNGEYSPKLLHKYETSSNELEDKIMALYARGLTVRDIQDNLKELYGMEVSATTNRSVTDKVWELVEPWQNRPLAAVYPSCIWMRCMSSCGAKVGSKMWLCTWSWAIGLTMARKEPNSG